MTVQARMREHILEAFYVSEPGELTDDLSLIDSGLVDSTGMLDIILFIEGEYGIHIEDSETVPENLETIGRIAGYVARKTATPA